MSLPKLDVSQYDFTVPSTGKKLRYRPFLVGEERVLLVAGQTGQEKDLIMATIDIVASCVTTPDFNIDTLTTFDFHWLFMKIRSKSVSEICELTATCVHCEGKTDIGLPVADIAPPQVPEKMDFKIQFSPTLGVTMRYPTVAMLRKYETSDLDDEVTLSYKTIIDAIENIYTDKELFDPRNEPFKEQQAFIDSLDKTAMSKLQDFIGAIPSVAHELTFKCRHCGKDNSSKLEGLPDFF